MITLQAVRTSVVVADATERPAKTSIRELGARQQFEQMASRIVEVEPAPTVP